MHSIRSSARRTAWAQDDNSKNYNPFARGTPGSRTSSRRSDDEEARLGRTRSGESAVLPTGSQYTNASGGMGLSDEPQHYSSGETLSNDQQYKQSDPIGQTNHQSGLASVDEASESNADAPGKESLRKRLFTKPDKKDLQKYDSGDGKSKWKNRPTTAWGEVKTVVFGSWINILLLLVPVCFGLNYAGADGKAIFVVSFISIIPLASTLSFATEELAIYVGETLGGLLNASFGNATELIVGIIALQQKKILIVQTSLIGSMLSNLLLVLGMCFFFGGMNRERQYFNITVAQTASSLLALAIGSLIIPTAFVRFGSATDAASADAGAAPISRGTSIILLLVYGSYLFFQLKTHKAMYNLKSKKVPKHSLIEKKSSKFGIATIGGQAAASVGGDVNREQIMQRPEDGDDDDDEGETPSLSPIGALITLGISTVLIAFCSEFLVTGIDSVAGSISQEFIGLILLPIVGNAAEHATAVTVAIKDKMDLAIGVAVGSSMQIALLVLPLMVVIGWCGLGSPDQMTLDFDGFQVSVLFIAVLLVNYLIQDGESHWLEGVLLMATYIIIALTAYFYPVNADLTG